MILLTAHLMPADKGGLRQPQPGTELTEGLAIPQTALGTDLAQFGMEMAAMQATNQSHNKVLLRNAGCSEQSLQFN